MQYFDRTECAFTDIINMVGFRKRVFARRKSFVPRKRFKFTRPRVPRPTLETKVVDFPVGETLSTTPTITHISAIANGTGDFQRIGNLVNFKYLHLALWINQTPGVGISLQADYCRVAIVYDKSPNGVLPTYASVFQATDNAGANTSDPFVKANIDTKHRFRVLYNQNLFLPAVGVAPTVSNGGVEEGVGRLRLNKFIYLRWMPSRHIGTTAVIGSVESGALYLLTETQTIAVGASASVLQGSIRVAYVDK